MEVEGSFLILEPGF